MNEYSKHPTPLVIRHKDRFKAWHRSSVFWDLVKEPDHPTYPTLKGALFKVELDAA